jgi:hypothetical protein
MSASFINRCSLAARAKIMKFPDEFSRWRILQAMAQQETDPQRLACIIDEMNRLLDADEPRNAGRHFDTCIYDS